jgi:hypothetical protein
MAGHFPSWRHTVKRRTKAQIDPEFESFKELRAIRKLMRDVVGELEAIAGLLMKEGDPEKIRQISKVIADQKKETEEALERNAPPDTPAA